MKRVPININPGINDLRTESADVQRLKALLAEALPYIKDAEQKAAREYFTMGGKSEPLDSAKSLIQRIQQETKP